MSKISLCCLLLVAPLVIIAGAVLTEAQVPQTTAPPFPVPDQFSRRVAGTYWVEGNIGSGSFGGMQSFFADRNWVSRGTACCGQGDPAVNGPQDGFLGVWEQSGPRQVTLTSIIFVFDPLGNVLFNARPGQVIEFSPDFQTAEGTITTELFLPTQNPVDPDEVPIFVAEGTISLQRLNVIY